MYSIPTMLILLLMLNFKEVSSMLQVEDDAAKKFYFLLQAIHMFIG